MSEKEGWDQYSNYLRLENVLAAQAPWSGGKGTPPAHDEMLFIIFHQTYELWFKQILFELDDIQGRFSGAALNDRDMQPVLARLERITAILRLLVRQIDVLETMSAQDFIDFRDSLRTASGFQSWQFRLIETRLGLRREDRIPVFHCDFDENLCPASKQNIRSAENHLSLYQQIDTWLARTPFIDRADYKFWDSYRESISAILDQKEQDARTLLNGVALESELTAIARGRRKFEGIFDPKLHAAAQKDKLWRLSWKALQAALFITLYRQEPVLQTPARLLSLLMDVDEQLALWRYRHALMVQRMMGASIGTGGSSGYGYLMETLERHRIFTDLFALSTYMIPSSALPALPAHLSSEMGYCYTATARG